MPLRRDFIKFPLAAALAAALPLTALPALVQAPVTLSCSFCGAVRKPDKQCKKVPGRHGGAHTRQHHRGLRRRSAAP